MAQATTHVTTQAPNPVTTQATLFTGGTILIDADPSSETPRTTDAILFVDGRVDSHGEAALAAADRLDAEARAAADRSAQASSARTAATTTPVERIDLAGGSLIPGVGDGHAHPMLGGVEALGPELRAGEGIQGILDGVARWKAEHPDAEWIVGGSYDASLSPNGHFDAKWLDAVTGDTPTILRSFDYHTAWVNTAALEAGGITADTPDPELGRIVRRDDGTPLGTLQESAANNFLAHVVPPFTTAQKLDSIERATRMYAEQGTTWIQDAWVDIDTAGSPDLEVYLQAAEQGRLHTRVNVAFRADPTTWRAQVDLIAGARDRIRALGHDRLTGNTVKFFLDGVIESHTAAMLEPYADTPGERGLPNWTPTELRDATAAFDEAGYQLHLHAIGDASNRLALDVLEAIRTTNPPRDRDHVIAHVAVLSPEDVDRFAELDVIANFEPFWAQCDSVMRELTIPHLGSPRDEHQYLIGSLARSGATVSFGSDWPVTTADWRPAFEAAVTRQAEGEAEAWLPEERVSAATALAAYTTGIARQALAPDRGTLEAGNVADAVWLSDDLLEVDPQRITALTVHGTWLAGDRTYSRG